MMRVKKWALRKPDWLSNPWFLAATLFYVAMFVLGSIRIFERSFIFAFNDKLLHFVAYFLLSVLVYTGLPLRPLKADFFVPRALFCLGIIGLAGAIDEIGQYFVGRDSSFDDWFADAAAVVVFLFLMAAMHCLSWARSSYKVEKDTAK